MAASHAHIAANVIVLTGMMGAGKSTVGHELAQRLGRTFHDTDALVEAEAGHPIPEIVAARGEAAFREIECDVVQSLADASHCVVATGGWTVADPGSRRALEALGPIVCLTGAPEALARRLLGDNNFSRPMLGGAADADRLHGVFESRRAVYDSLPLQVDTTDRTPRQVADRVLGLLAATSDVTTASLPVSTPAGGYSVLVGDGLLGTLGEMLLARGSSGRVGLVSDEHVTALYGARTQSTLEASGLDVESVDMGVGEEAKSLSTASMIYDRFVDADLDRQATVIALGGGVVGDTAGFAAATYLRGLPVIQVPTSLLAMVDASIGGKTGVNLPAGKNLIGVFHHPALVVADPAVLATLPARRLREGLAEIVKTALIGDPDLLDEIERVGAPHRDDATAWARIVKRAAAVKASIVSQDPHEHGRRVVLNLGHTFAHALEMTTDYRLSHGEAVSLGLVTAADLATRLGLTDQSFGERIAGLLASLDLPVRDRGPTPDEVLVAMRPDKKRQHGKLRFVLPRAPGDVTVVDEVPDTMVVAALASVLGDPTG